MDAKELGAMSAHPIREQHWREDHPDFHGLTKREAFAMAAMQGLCANPAEIFVHADVSEIVEIAVNHADALLRKLAKPQP